MQSNLQMKAFVINLLRSRIPSIYYFHDHEHTLYVIDKTIEIAKQENCTEKEITLLSVAALWHDLGYINIYKGHEKESCKLAREYLPGYGFSDDDINTMCGMIMATKIPQSPQTKLEEILADADLEYLGTENVAIEADKLFRELQALNPALTEQAWNQQQISFLQGHKYFTAYCKKNKAGVKSAYLEKLLHTV